MLPTLVLKNDHGEVSDNFILGGSSQLSALFTVAAADAAGKGLTGLHALGIASVFLHTSQTPATGNPNPAAGYAVVNFLKAISGLTGFNASFRSPLSGSSINVTTGVTQGLAYVITALGTTTAAQWQILGLPVGVVPAVGQSFIAIATGTATGTGTIQVQSAAGSTVYHAELVGDTGANGKQAVIAIYGPTSVSNPTLKVIQPPDGTVMVIEFAGTQPVQADE